ncbi:MAG: helix-turn-helix domain-containing protein [Pseudobdellovibrionaceae bacterium]
MHKVLKPKDIGALIKTKRTKKELSQQELADICGVGRRFISEIETAKKESYDLSLILRVLQRLGYEIQIIDKEE